MTDLNQNLTNFMEGVQRIVDSYRAKHCPNLGPVTFSLEHGPKNIRVVKDDGQRSVFCFINAANGDVLKADGWKKPAKHARGNIFAPDNGLSSIGPFGPAYLR